ncbi:dTDP-4-dehydrorhamnose reductase [Trinickia sp. NRRL B-1857]|uniref:dTDP-4-dehydrorhamnose reductase n=1 Tax=Trinickia sp. NRRL B-1857 TaxID=3162879 RepID=UPI003D2715DF
MRIMVTGAKGQVGWELTRSLAALGEVLPHDRARADLSQPHTLKAVVAAAKPDVLVNAAAYTAVDKAEEDEAGARAVNAEAVGVLAEAAREAGALFVHYSTDYVFDGTKPRPYLETDAPNPLGVYGATKLEGERAVAAAGGDWLVFRTSWVYGPRGRNFLRTMLRLAAQRETLNVVSDQTGAPTSARAIAQWSAHAIRQAMAERASSTFEQGLFHLTAEGSTSWHGFASRIVEAARRALGDEAIRARSVEPIATAQYPTPARRPANSVLDNTAFERRFGLWRQPWDAAMEDILDDVFERMRDPG